MKLKWLGHATFQITAADGTVVVTDPHNPATSGYAPFRDPADVVIMSSDNDSFHCNTRLVPGDHVTINALTLARDGGSRQMHGIRFSAIEAMENVAHREFHPDQNGMYRMQVDGISIGHMGDVGNSLSMAQLEFFAGVDVLLALVGGYPTIALSDLTTLIHHVKPRLVVPMHFRTLTYKPRNSNWLEVFLRDIPSEDVDFACACEVDLTPQLLPATTRVLVLDYAR